MLSVLLQYLGSERKPILQSGVALKKNETSNFFTLANMKFPNFHKYSYDQSVQLLTSLSLSLSSFSSFSSSSASSSSSSSSSFFVSENKNHN